MTVSRWSKEDPDAPSALELVEQIHECFYGPDIPVPFNVVRHWDHLLEMAEDAACVSDEIPC